ncbi:MAG: pyridoxamine 5'-phosphate oxidase [Bacteroides sp.]|jgi:pyridoxamine 5'-phosphate oxidase|nr:pyridoxamine 5'-phosphate oxidase [Bacteroides sp.]
MVKKNLAHLRQEYAAATFDESVALGHPFSQFSQWFDQALESGIPEPNAMTLATTDQEGKPRARVVLLKTLDETGFVFFTNYDSHKGNQLQVNPYASLVFLWLELQRQVRVEGKVEMVTEEESDTYFALRPRTSQIGAWASPQSQEISGRHYLEKRYQAFEKKFENREVPRPTFWGGFRLIPEHIEFWQGRQNRLHDRLVYEMQDGQWTMKRLAP